MNPVTVELLNSAEKYRRSKHVKVCQLLNQSRAGRSGQPSLRERVMYALGALLRRGKSTAEKPRVPSDVQVLGQATK